MTWTAQETTSVFKTGSDVVDSKAAQQPVVLPPKPLQCKTESKEVKKPAKVEHKKPSPTAAAPKELDIFVHVGAAPSKVSAAIYCDIPDLLDGPAC